ncbi:hypothetical protein MMC11_002688, partial [Xylographa trunciseda]|nr:hypothetical protein [Xylographa trunciseda]
MSVHIPRQKRQRIDGDTDQAERRRAPRPYTHAESAILKEAASILNVAVQDLPSRQESLPRASHGHRPEAHLSLPHELYQLDFDIGQNDIARSDRQLEAMAAVPISPSAICYGVNESDDAQPGVMLRDRLSAPRSECIGNVPAFPCAGTNVRTQSDPPSVYPVPFPPSIRNGSDFIRPTAVHAIGLEKRPVEMGWINSPVNGSSLGFHAESIPPCLELEPGMTDNIGDQGLPLGAFNYSASPTLTTDIMGVPGVYFNEQNEPEFQFQFDNFEAIEDAMYNGPVVMAPFTQPQAWMLQTQQRPESPIPGHFTIQQHSEDDQMPEVFNADLSFGLPPYTDALEITDFSDENSQLTSSANLLPDSIPYPLAKQIDERQLELRGLSPYSAWTMATRVIQLQQETTAPERQSTTRNVLDALDTGSLNLAAKPAANETIVFQGPAPHRSDERQGPRVRQSFQDLGKRKETGQTRMSGACVRCHMQKIRCSPAEEDKDSSCATCARISGPTLRSLPCVRYNIMDSSLFDKGQHPQFRWSQRWSSWDLVEIDTWASPEVKTIMVTQDVLGGSAFKIKCRQFKPLEGDSLARTWKKDGSTVYYQRAPYAILSMKET